MDLQTRKLNLITYLAQIQDENFLENIENFIFTKIGKSKKDDFKPFSIEELLNRIEKSEKNYADGNYKTQDDLEKISANW